MSAGIGRAAYLFHRCQPHFPFQGAHLFFHGRQALVENFVSFRQIGLKAAQMGLNQSPVMGVLILNFFLLNLLPGKRPLETAARDKRIAIKPKITMS